MADSKGITINFYEEKFEKHHVASIHNHTKDVFSPPSGKNFGILMREFEDYELIAGVNDLWILKAKGIHNDLIAEFNVASIIFFSSSKDYCSARYDDFEIINNVCEVMYGNQLSKYINDKNIKDIQLYKKEYSTMTNNSKGSAEFSSFKRITDPEEIRISRKREKDPNVLSGKDLVYAFYQMMGMEIDYDEIFKMD